MPGEHVGSPVETGVRTSRDPRCGAGHRRQRSRPAPWRAAARQARLSSTTPIAQPAMHLGEQLGVVGDGLQLDREAAATRDIDVDDHPRLARPLADHVPEGPHRLEEPLRRRTREPDVEDPPGPDVEGRGRRRRDRGFVRPSLVREGRLLVVVGLGHRRPVRLLVGGDRLGRRDRRQWRRGRGLGGGVLAERRNERDGREDRRRPTDLDRRSVRGARADRHHRSLARCMAVAAAVGPVAAGPTAGSAATTRPAIARGDLRGERLGSTRDRIVPIDGQVGQERRVLAAVVDPPGDQQDRPVPPGRPRRLVQPREDDDLDRPLQVFERDDGHRLVPLRDDRPDAGHDAADDHPLPVERFVLQVARVRVDEPADLLGDLAHRVLREVQAQQFLLPAKALAHRHLGRRRERPLEDVGVRGPQVEQRGLAGDPVALRRLGGADGVVETEEQLRGMAHRAEGPDLDERLEHLAVAQAQVDPRAEVGQRAEVAALVASRDDRLDRPLPHVLDGQQAEADRVALDGELQVARMDVRREDGDPEPAAFGDGRRDLLLVRPEGRQHARHVLDGVVRLQVGGLVGDEPITRRVGLVEPVTLERLEGGEDRVDGPGRHAPLGGLGDEPLLLGAQHRGLLLADGVAQGVGLGTGEPAEGDGRGHDVLLVHEDPVGLLQVRLEQRVQVRDRFLAVLAPDVGRDVVHRSRPVERHHRREVIDGRRPEVADIAAHPRGLELEDAGRLARGQEFEGLRVVERDRVEVDGDLPVGLHHVDRLAQDGQVREPEEVELQQPERLDGVHLVLGHEPIRVRRLLERHELGQRLAADDDARGVGRGVARHALEVPGEVDDPGDARVGIHLFAQCRGDRQGLVELDPELVRDRLGDPVHLAVRVTQDPADVADRRAGQHRAERDDLGDVVLAVLAPDVGDDLVAAAVLEVDVDVGHRHAIRVQEPLERELVQDRVDRRDAERVRHDRARRAAPARRLDALSPGEVDEVGDDEEVRRVAHRDDDPELVVEALLQLRRDGPVPALEAALALLPQPRSRRCGHPGPGSAGSAAGRAAA